MNELGFVTVIRLSEALGVKNEVTFVTVYRLAGAGFAGNFVVLWVAVGSLAGVLVGVTEAVKNWFFTGFALGFSTGLILKCFSVDTSRFACTVGFVVGLSLLDVRVTLWRFALVGRPEVTGAVVVLVIFFAGSIFGITTSG